MTDTQGTSLVAVTPESLLSDIGATIRDPLKLLHQAREHGIKFSDDEFSTLHLRAGRNQGPLLLCAAWALGVIGPDTVTASIALVWSGVEFPHEALARRDWLRLFNVAGFTVSGKAADRPDKPIRLYRGSTPGRRTGFSWSADREMAEWFARRLITSPPRRPAPALPSSTRPMRPRQRCCAFPAMRDVRLRLST